MSSRRIAARQLVPRRRCQVLLAAYLAAVGLACAAFTGSSSAARPLSPAAIAFWDRVAHCEQPLGAGARWSHPGPTYQGGLGFYFSTWDWWARELGLHRRYPDAGDAPRLVQIRVADYGRRVHRGYWGCIR